MYLLMRGLSFLVYAQKKSEETPVSPLLHLVTCITGSIFFL